MIDLKGRRALVMGVANDRSIGWGITQSLAEAGADLALSYLPDAKGRAERRVERLASSLDSVLLLPCDVRKDTDIEMLFAGLGETWGSLDILIHSIAWARVDELAKGITETSRGGFSAAQEISTYSLVAAARHASKLMSGRSGSIVAVTYLGSQRAIPHYDVMGVAKAGLESTVRYLAAELGPAGVRVNAVSPGPIETLSAAAIPDFDVMLKESAARAPLGRTVTARDVGDVATFLCSDLARGVTGEIIHVDAGFHVT
jgi:enoyl-[acyl-carrier protein] reductase I